MSVHSLYLRAALMMTFLGGAHSLAAQSDTLPDRDAAKAFAFGVFVPGAGHIYAGETLRGFGLFGVVALDAATAIEMYNQLDCRYARSDDTRRQCNRDIHRWIADEIVLGVTVWTISALDAPRAVRRRIRAHQARRQTSSAPGLEWKLLVGESPQTSRGLLLGARATW